MSKFYSVLQSIFLIFCSVLIVTNLANLPVLAQEVVIKNPKSNQSYRITVEKTENLEMFKNPTKLSQFLIKNRQNSENEFAALDFKYLPVPYFNQCLETDGKTFSPNNITKAGKEACRYMCAGASMVMIGGYFDKLKYDKNNSWDLKKYMNSDSGQNIGQSCGENQGGAFGLIARETDIYTKGLSSCDQGSGYGITRYADKIGLFSKVLTIETQNLKNAIKRGNPIVASSGSHIFVINGYFGNKFIISDPYRDLSIDEPDYSLNGQNALYGLDNLFYKGKVEKITYAYEISDKNLVK